MPLKRWYPVSNPYLPVKYHEVPRGYHQYIFCLALRPSCSTILARTGESWHYSGSNASRSYSSRILRAVYLCVLTLPLGDLRACFDEEPNSWLDPLPVNFGGTAVQPRYTFFFFFSHTSTFQLLDKPWSQVSSLLPPGSFLQFLSRIGFNNPTARRIFIECLLTHALVPQVKLCARKSAHFIRVCARGDSNSRN